MDTKSISENGNSPNVIEYFHITWQGIPISIKWDPECHLGIISHLEIQSEKDVKIPITETGYKSHFCDKQWVMKHGWPVAYIKKRMEQEAQSNEWISYEKSKDIQTLF